MCSLKGPNRAFGGDSVDAVERARREAEQIELLLQGKDVRPGQRRTRHVEVTWHPAIMT